MKKYLVLFLIVLMGLILVFAFASGKKKVDIKNVDLSVHKQEMKSNGVVKPDLDFGKIPLYFISNKGQVNEKAKFYAKASRYTLWLTKEGLVFDSTKKSEVKGRPESPHSPHSTKIAKDVSRFIFLGANKSPEIVPVEEAKLKVNYFIGNDKSKWHCDIPTTRAVLYKNLYKNIHLKVYGLEKQIEYDWIVKPGGNPGDIRFQYKNVKGTRIDKEGNLLIETEFGELMHKKPVCYQPRDLIYQTREEITGQFKKIAANTYGFAVGKYDQKRELIIDPVVLAYSTYLGGGGEDYGDGIAVDGSGNAYVTGYTYSTNFPILNQYHEDQVDLDAFVTKLDTTQSGSASLLYSTYLGGGGDDRGYDITVDSSGNVYLTGCTKSTDFPTLNQYQAHQGGFDGFVTRLDTNQGGTASLLYSTYLGGGDHDYGWDIAVDAGGYVYITGVTLSLNFPTLNQYQEDQGMRDGFVTKLDTTQSGSSSLLYSTYLGGGDVDYGWKIAVDGSGNAYVTGFTTSTDFPTLNQYQGDQLYTDAFVTKLDTTQSGGASLLYSTYLGGGSDDSGYDITVDGSGNAYVTGWTDSVDFPTFNQYQADQDGRDAFVTKLDTTQSGGASLLYSTYLGGGSDDEGLGIAIDGSGNAYVMGYTNSTDFPTLYEFQADQGGIDVFITRLDPTQSGTSGLLYSTYLGGESDDYGSGPALDGSGKSYVTGYTDSTDFPTLNQYQDNQGGADAFVTKLSYTVLGPEINIKQESIEIPDQGSFDFGSTAQGAPVEKIFTIENTGTADLTLNDLPLQITGPDAGQFSISQQPSSPVSSQSSTTFTISFNPTSEGNKTASISIANNDPDENPYDITLNGSSLDEPGPGWEPVGGLQYNMIVLGTAYNQNSPAFAGDWIGAFGPGGENDCRAIAPVEANGSYYLTVQGDSHSGEQINFKLWPLPAGPALDSLESMVFLADHVYQDQELHFGFRSITLDLITGWNWISSNVLPPETSFDSIFSGIADNIQQVKSQQQSAIRTGGDWVGDLVDMSGIGSSYMYKIKTDAPCSLTLNGTLISHDTPISLDNLWTWVAYLPTSGMPVADAVDTVFPILDQVKSQIQSVLKVGSNLIGDLSEMQAGLGYMIKTTAAGILQYPGTQMLTLNNAIANDSDCTPPWTPITGNQYTMIALGNVYLAGELITTTGFYISSFGPGGIADCRSLSEVTGNGTYFSTLRGKTNGETIGFKLYECATGKTYEIEETLLFLSDDLKQGFDLHTAPPVISGCVTDNSTGLAGVTLTFGSTGTTTGADGNYSCQVEYDWTGRVTPEPEGYTFEPAFRDYANITSNQENQNYTAELVKTITITSPNGGEDWIAGSIEKITWDGPGIIGNLMIEYSENNGTSWTTITKSAANTGSYDWTVPGTPSGNCLIRVIAGDTDVSPADVSDTVFSIDLPSPAAITVTSPNGAESLTIGSKYEITWNSTGDIGEVKIEYSIDNGTSWLNIAVSTDNDHSYTWTVPDSPSDNCMVRIGASDADENTPDVSDGVFSIVPGTSPTITVTSPNGGESLQVGTTHQITWNSTGTIGDIKIEYSTNNGTLWTAITTSAPNNGSYDWAVPGNPSETCLVRVSETDGDPSDISDAVFSIVLPPSITITSPNGGENWEVGSSHPITWTSIGRVKNVKIEYTTDNGTSWETIDSSAVNDGSHNWTVPDKVSDSCLVRISESDRDEGSSDAGDAVFSIIPASSPTLTVTSPNGGEHLSAGSIHGITWTNTGGVENVKIEYSPDNGNNWAGIIASTVNTGSYDWTVPDTVSASCLVRVGDSDGDPADASNAVFSIAPPSFITTTSPNGGETLAAGTTHHITWTGTGIPEEVKIEYSPDNGTSWTTIVTSAPSNGNSGSYNWTIPGTPSGNCLVRISGDDKDEGLSDLSDAVFSIEPAPVITLTSPNGGESLTTGSIHEITWTCTGSIAEVKIDYSIDDGTSWAYIVPAAANNGANGSYNWIVPGTPSGNCLVRISGADTDEAPEDVSDAVFSIISPSETVTVTSPNGGECLSAGSTHAITWTCSGSVDRVNIEYSINHGTTWTGIISSASNSGSFEWIVPDTPSGNCLVRISDSSGGSSDVSDAAFSIVSPSSVAITVTSPNGGESLSEGSAHMITWTNEETVGDVKIEYSIDSGNSWTMIELAAGNNGANGSYNWIVPGTPSDNCLVRISGVDRDEVPTDVSDAVFSII